MRENHKKYTQEFRQQIVDLYNTGNYSFSQLLEDYGITKPTLSQWINDLSPIQVSGTEIITLQEYKSLQKKIYELELENEILRKAAALYSGQ